MVSPWTFDDGGRGVFLVVMLTEERTATSPPTHTPGSVTQELQESIEQPARFRAHSGRLPAYTACSGCSS